MIFIPWFVPAYKAGGPIQSIANLVDKYENADFRIYTSNRDMDGSILPVETDRWLKYNTRTEVWYASKKNQRINLMKHEVKSFVPDVIYINGIYDWYFNFVPMVFITGTRRIIATRGMVHPNALKQKALKKRLYIKLLKSFKVQENSIFHGTNMAELVHIGEAFGSKVKRAFIAVNYPRLFKKQAMPLKTPGSLKLCTIALISPMKNHLKLLSELKEMTGEICYHIYGPVRDPGYWKECLEVIASLPANIMVTYHGDLEPGRVEQILSECHVFIMPSESENYGHSIVEALSAGRPVITSRNVPWGSLRENHAGININMDDPEENDNMKKHINYFLNMGQSDIQVWSEGAHDYILSKQKLESVTEFYDGMFQMELK